MILNCVYIKTSFPSLSESVVKIIVIGNGGGKKSSKIESRLMSKLLATVWHRGHKAHLALMTVNVKQHP